ncbi:hypothetical protein [Gordonibacter massiliensis (ex Traore et al. 2017)]|nr:hypothetical protein [Gordonibacter massiliensis (ex Traore et al. 2017)]
MMLAWIAIVAFSAMFLVCLWALVPAVALLVEDVRRWRGGR